MCESSNPNSTAVTTLLAAMRQGDAHASSQLFDMLYHELRALAHAVFASEANGHTMQPTALVHEVWLKLSGSGAQVESQRHFFALAAKVMRQVLADHARTARRAKRGGSRTLITLQDDLAVANGDFDVVAFNDLLDQLTRLNPRHAQVLELRVLGGLTIDETAASLELSRGTIELDWAMAKAWFRARLTEF